MSASKSLLALIDIELEIFLAQHSEVSVYEASLLSAAFYRGANSYMKALDLITAKSHSDKKPQEKDDGIN